MKKFLPWKHLLASICLLFFSVLSFAQYHDGANNYPSLQAAITAASPGDLITIDPGTYAISSTVNVNKSVTIDGGSAGTTKLQTSGTGYLLLVTAPNVAVKNLEIEKTDLAGVQNIIGVQGNNFELAFSNIHGQYIIGGTEVERGLEVSTVSGLNVHNNTFKSLRQPGYINNAVSGSINNNFTAVTRGWVVASDATVTFSNNTWGTGANFNAEDIAIINQSGSVNNYPDIVAVSNANNGGMVENQHVSYPSPILTPVYVSSSAPNANSNGTALNPYPTISQSIPRSAVGGKIFVAAGTYNENVTITKAVSLRGANYGVSCSSGGRLDESVVNGTMASGSTTIKVNSDGVTIDGFSITNHNGSLGISGSGRSNLDFEHNLIYDIGNSTTGKASSWGIDIEAGVSQNSSNITASNNCINNIRGGANTALTGSTASANNGSGGGILVGSSGDTKSVSGVIVNGNIIDHITASTAAFGSGGKGAYGVQFNVRGGSTGNVTSSSITNNEINTLEGLWAHGVGLEGRTPNAQVTNNLISNLVDHKGNIDADGVRFEDNDASGSVVVNNNSFTNMRFGISNVTAATVNGTCNWYGSADNATVSSMIEGPVTFSPYLTSGGDGAGVGFQPTGTCNGPLPKPVLTATANGNTLTSNNNGVSEAGENSSYSVCDADNNISFNAFKDLNNSAPAGSVKVRQEFVLNNLTWCCTDGNFALSDFGNGGAFTRSARLINPGSPGTLTMRFRSFFDANNNNSMDPEEPVGDWLTYTVTVNPQPVVSFDLTDNSPHHATNVNNGSADPTEAVTLSVCNGNTYTLSNLVNSSPGNRYKIEASTSGGGLLFNGSGTGNADISASDFSGAQGTYTVTLVDPNTGGTVVQRITPYYDANGNHAQDPGECSGDPITITYNGTPQPTWYLDNDGDGHASQTTRSCSSPGVHWTTTVLPVDDCNDNDANVTAQPKLSTTINGVTVNSNNDGIDDQASFSVCNQTNNIHFGQYTDLNGNSGPSVKASQVIVQTTNVTVPFCNNCTGPLSLFNGTNGSAALVDPDQPGTLVIKFKEFIDKNDNGQIDNAECVASDWVVYTVTVNPQPTWYLDQDGDQHAASTTRSCTSPGAGWTMTVLPVGDCNDNDPTVWRNGTFYVDQDGDGYTVGNGVVVCYGQNTPAGYSATKSETDDCNDNDPTVHSMQVYYRDVDGDGLGDPFNSGQFCSSTPPAGYVSNNYDCDDTKLEKNPGDNQVLMCHNGKEECVPSKDVQKHLDENNSTWSVGPCNQSSCGPDQTLMCHDGKDECVPNKDVQKHLTEAGNHWKLGSCTSPCGSDKTLMCHDGNAECVPNKDVQKHLNEPGNHWATGFCNSPCGSDKTLMCHDGKEECVPNKDVQKHLNEPGGHWATGFCSSPCGADQTLMCHDGKPECVPTKDVQKHLDEKGNHWVVGSCPSFVNARTAEYTYSANEQPSITQEYKLSNYPNPFSNTTTIKYSIPVDSRVSIKVFTLTGQVIATLVDADKKAGSYSVDFNASSIAKGMYYCKLVATSGSDQTVKSQQLSVVR